MNRWFLWASVGILVFAPCFACGGGSAGTGPGPDVLDVPSTDGSADLPAEVSLDSAPDAIDIVADAPPDVPDVPVVIEPADRPLCTPVTQAAATVIPIDPAGAGRIFDGLGAISNAGNSRFLIDYPEPQRSQVLDYFFKPGYGAALQVLKVEMAGDMNSTTGSEASHMHTSEGLDCGRGYEWWLMKEAKARNPSIVLAALEGPLTAAARFVFPTTSPYEADGTWVNESGVTQRVRRAVEPVGDAKGFEVWASDLADRLGTPLAARDRAIGGNP